MLSLQISRINSAFVATSDRAANFADHLWHSCSSLGLTFSIFFLLAYVLLSPTVMKSAEIKANLALLLVFGFTNC